MKTEKIVSITMINAFALMLFGSFLSGCQKKSISKTGFYTTLKEQGRTPASNNEFDKIQDPKQVYIYCSLNELNPKSCFNLFIEQKISKQNNKELTKPEFNQVKTEVETLNNQIISMVLPEIKKFTENRESFCEKNSKYYLNRCLHQYVNKESTEVLNKFQNKNVPLNGHEYLYIQKQIEGKMKELLQLSEQYIIDRKKKAL